MLRGATLVGLCCLLLLVGASHAKAQSDIATEAPGWCDYAKQYLSGRDGSPFDCAKAGRCIKMNNYGCVKNHSAVAAPGQLKTADGKPIHDAQRHVLFEQPKWSLHRSISTLLSYYSDMHRSLYAIAGIWAPWCDTIGSKVMNGEWGRTCTDGPSVLASFKGPRCEEPSKAPLVGQCDHCNCPNVIASFYSKGVTDNVYLDLQLFDANRKPLPIVQKLLPRIFMFETGYVPSEQLVADAIASFEP